MDKLNSSSISQNFCYEMPPSIDTPRFVSGDGVRLKDNIGRVWLDGISGVFVTWPGHGCKRLVDAASQQAETMAFSAPLHGICETTVRLAEAVADFAPDEFDCVKFVTGGSEANEVAVRIARLWQTAHGKATKRRILSFYNSYHGSTYGALSMTGRPDTGRFDPKLPGFVHLWPADCVRCPVGDSYPGCAMACIDLIERTISSEGADYVAALVMEPTIHLLGMATPPNDFFRELRKICDKYDILLVFDEVVTGFGRLGTRFAAERIGVMPDIMTAGKGITGGYAPLAAVIMNKKVSTVLRDKATGAAAFAPTHTYAGNPVSAAVGIEALDLLRESDMIASVRAREDGLKARLERAVAGRGLVRGHGFLWGIVFDAEAFEGVENVGALVQAECLKNGLILRGEADWLVAAPAFVMEESDLDLLAEGLACAVNRVQEMTKRSGGQHELTCATY